jgi:hypothetical protein
MTGTGIPTNEARLFARQSKRLSFYAHPTFLADMALSVSCTSFISLPRDVLKSHLFAQLDRGSQLVCLQVCRLFRSCITGRCASEPALPVLVAQAGHLALMQRMAARVEVPALQALAVGAASGGQILVLEWLRGHSTSRDMQWSAVCAAAAEAGKPSVLDWLERNGFFDRADERLAPAAARGGHLPVLQWLRDRGAAIYGGTSIVLARCGNKELLRWYRNNGGFLDEHVYDAAVAAGHVHLAAWLLDQNRPL